MISTRLKGQKKSIIRQIVDSAPQNSINLGLGELKIPPPKNNITLVEEILKNEKVGYTPNAGLTSLIAEIQRYYKHKAEYVCVTNGAEEAIFATLFSILDSGDEISVADPDYSAYHTIAKLLDAVPKRFFLDPKKQFSLDRTSLQKSITNRTKVIIISNPSNPLGIIYTKPDLDYIIGIAVKHDLVLIVDEIYNELIFQGCRDSLIGQANNVVVISGLSKSYQFTGWRLGWVVTNQAKLAKAITVSHQYISTCAGYISQSLAQNILSQHEEHTLDRLRQKLLQKRNLVCNIIKENTSWYILPNQAAPYLFIRVTKNSREFCKQKAAKGVIAIPGTAFGTNCEGWIRINYALPNNELIKGLKILTETL